MTPAPGDFVVISTRGSLSRLIRAGEHLVGGYTTWTHAAICSQVAGLTWIVEAEPGGAVERPFHYEGYPHEWSSLTLTANQRASLVAAAIRYVGTPYSFADYAAIAAHRFAPFLGMGLKHFIADSRHMICSQLIDQCYQDAGIHLFTDGRWPGYVTPGDLGNLLRH